MATGVFLPTSNYERDMCQKTGDCGEGCICGGQALGVNLRGSDHFLSLHADETRVSIGRNDSVLSTGFIM